MRYTDGFVLVIPKAKIDEYTALATHAGSLWMEHGALAYRELLADDLDMPHGISFKQLTNLEEENTVVFAYIEYRDRAHRDQVNAAVMADPRIHEGPPMDQLPFDMNRMTSGGFRSLVDLG